MKALSLIIILFTVNTFAQSNTSTQNLINKDKKSISKFIGSIKDLQEESPNLTTSDTCLDEFLSYRSSLLKSNLTLPLKGIGGTLGASGLVYFAIAVPLNFVAPVYATALIGSFTYIGKQISGISRAIKLNKAGLLITQARLGNGRRLKKAIKKISKKLKSSNDLKQQVIDVIINADQDSKFCDSSLKSKRNQRKFKKKGHLKHAISTEDQMIKYIVKSLSN